ERVLPRRCRPLRPDVRNLTPLSGQSKRGQVASLSDNVEGAAVTQWAVVTGAGNGLGAVIARQAVKAGYRLAAWDIDEQSLASLATEFGDECLRAVVDVSDEATVAALPEPPALLVNNAGVVRFGPLLSLSAQDWRRAVDVNLTGTFLVGRAIAARMIEAGGGAIVNIASINGIAAAPNAGAYTASKAAV